VTDSNLTTENMRESISAMMDDEAQQMELQRVLKASEDQPEVRAQWQRYQLTSSMLKRQADHVSMDTDIADRVRAALQHEEALQLTPQVDVAANESGAAVAQQSWWKPVTGFAVAASATLMMVLGIQQTNLLTQPGVPVDTGIVLVEPGQSNTEFQQFSTGSATAVQASGEVLRGLQAADGTSALWMVSDLPEGFLLIQRSMDDTGAIAREALRFSNGSSEFTLYVEPLMGRSISEGHAYTGDNLVFGQQLTIDGKQVFVTLVGDVALQTAKQVAGSVAANTNN
jgi:negative regulator of sigma E activity